MLYELIGIVRPGNLAEVKELVQMAGSLVIKEKGVIRGIANWGVFSLPKALTVQQMRHQKGHYFCMRYDSSVKTQEQVRRVLADDPRMIRQACVKLGDGKLGTMTRFGSVAWREL